MSQDITLARARPYAQTAHAAVRRVAFDQAGGFAEDVRSGGDADLCFRWPTPAGRSSPGPRRGPPRGPRRAASLLGQIARHGSGAAWLERRHPGTFPREPGGPGWPVGRARASVRALSCSRAATAIAPPGGARAATVWAFELGRRLPNDAPAVAGGRLSRLDRFLR
jgi:hypothetical protein